MAEQGPKPTKPPLLRCMDTLEDLGFRYQANLSRTEDQWDLYQHPSGLTAVLHIFFRDLGYQLLTSVTPESNDHEKTMQELRRQLKDLQDA